MQKKLNTFCQILLMVVTGLLLLPACGGDNGALGDIPVPPPDAQNIPDELLPAAPDVMAETYKAQYNVRDLKLAAYTLPSEISFEAVEAYYAALLSDKWETYNTNREGLEKPPGMQVTVWTNPASRELLSIQYMESSQYGGNMLLVLYMEQ